MKKRGQVSLFVLLGVLLVAGSGILLFANHEDQKDIVPEIYKQEKVPREFEPIKKYVDDCIYKSAVTGIKKAGEKGGYVEMDDFEINTESFNIFDEVTESDAVRFSEGSDYAIPYWWHLYSRNDCTGVCQYSTKRPELRESYNSIEKQLERYITKEVKACVNDFEIFKEEGYEIEQLEDIYADVVIGEKSTIVLVDYPIKGKKGSTAEFSKYYTEVGINLQKIYNLASSIAAVEQDLNFLEHATTNLIGSFAGVDSERLPPMSDMRFDFSSSTRWTKSEVKRKIEEMLMSYIPIFQVQGTKNFERNVFEDNKLRQSIYDWFIVPLEGDNSDITIEFSYLDFWPMYFDLNCNGESCEAQSANSPFISFLGIQEYKFKYDVSYPVLVEITQPDALDKEGYSFRFFIEANIRNNKPLEVDFSPIKVEDNEATMLCDYDLRNSKEVTVKVIDSITKEPIEKVNIMHGVGNEACFIGTTDKEGILKAQFPTGTIGGFVTLSKYEYLEKAELFDASNDEEQEVEIELDPIFEKKVIVKKKNLKKERGWSLLDSAVPLYPDERAVLTLKRHGNIEEEEFTTAFEYGRDSEDVIIRIAPGEYELKGNMMLYRKLKIPEKRVHEDGGVFGSDVDYTIPEIEFTKTKPFPSGGITMNMTIDGKELIENDNIIFYVVSADLASVPESSREHEDINQMSRYEEVAQESKESFIPEFEKDE